MSHDIQEYINGLVNKRLVSLGFSDIILTGEITDLSELVNLVDLVISNSLITNTNLDFLNTLPNKEKLNTIDFSGNQIQEIDFADLFTKFPNLEKINLQNNPVSVKKIDVFYGEFWKLVKLIKEQKIKFDPLNSPKGTIAKDLLDHAQKLIADGGNLDDAYWLREFILGKQLSNSSKDDKTPLLISGLIVIGFFALVIGCWLRQKRKKVFYE